MKLLSVIVPVYNEERTIEKILDLLCRLELIKEFSHELIVVNDASTDSTDEKIQAFLSKETKVKVNYFTHQKNRGKGAAIHTGIEKANGDYLIIQDADLEYDPEEYSLLLKPVLKDNADVVYGSRFMGHHPHRILFFWHSIGNKFLTSLSNVFTNLNLTDMETCYKLMRADIVKGFKLKEKRFGFEPEITAKLSKVEGIKIYEVGISYYGRTYKEGKKINWKDGFRAMYCIFRYNLFS